MRLSKTHDHAEVSLRSPLPWLAPAAFVLSLGYLAVAAILAPDLRMALKGFLFPLRLFLIASAPMIGGLAFLWADKAISDTRRRRIACVLMLLLWAFGAIALLSLLPW